MVTPLTDAEGQTVHVLETSDLDEVKNSLIRWLLFTVIPLTLLLGVYATRLDARNESQDAVMNRNSQRLDKVDAMKEQVDSIRIEMRHLTDALTALNQTVARTAR